MPLHFSLSFSVFIWQVLSGGFDVAMFVS